MGGLPDLLSDPFALPYSPPFSPDAPEVGRIIDAEACNTWTESAVHSPTVSAVRLAIPSKASGEYEKACGAFKGKRYSDAEQHLRTAIQIYPDYAAAWVVLGQVLEAQQRADDAQSACAKAHDLDPGYVASYLCLAEFAARQGAWKEVADLSARALELDPVNNPYAFYYAASAGLHFRQFVQAELHAQAALKLDTWHHLPELHLLLANIFDAEGNAKDEVTQLREYLKLAPNSKDAAFAKTTLAKVEATPAK